MTTTKKTTTNKAKASKAKKGTGKRQTPASKPASAAKAIPGDANAPAVGTTLRRSFKGQDITVKVTADGFVYEGQTFASISAVARHITGYMISGPVFFKLVAPKRVAKAAK